MKNGYVSLIGYILFAFGAIGIIMSLVGLQITGLSIIDNYSPLVGFVVKMVLMVLGIVILYVAKSTSDPELS